MYDLPKILSPHFAINNPRSNLARHCLRAIPQLCSHPFASPPEMPAKLRSGTGQSWNCTRTPAQSAGVRWMRSNASTIGYALEQAFNLQHALPLGRHDQVAEMNKRTTKFAPHLPSCSALLRLCGRVAPLLPLRRDSQPDVQSPWQ
jgi:hypothetical protein